MLDTMANVTAQEIKDSIEELLAYRDRIKKEVTQIAQKLRMPKKKIDIALEEHEELRHVNKMLAKLLQEQDRSANS